eukprot:172359-Pyramimonas_sp.AAC.1
MAWRATGARRFWTPLSRRWLALSLRIHGVACNCVAGYASTQRHAADRAAFFEGGDELFARLPA